MAVTWKADGVGGMAGAVPTGQELRAQLKPGNPGPRKMSGAICAARRNLENPGDWVQGTYHGWFGGACILGAFDDVAKEGKYDQGTIDAAILHVTEAIPGRQGIPEWNDRMMRTQSQVLRTLWEIENELSPGDHVLCERDVVGGPQHSGRAPSLPGPSLPGPGVRGRVGAIPARWKVGGMFVGTELLLMLIAPVLAVVLIVCGVAGAGVWYLRKRQELTAELVDVTVDVVTTPAPAPCEPERVEVPRPSARPRRAELGAPCVVAIDTTTSTPAREPVRVPARRSRATQAPAAATASSPVAWPVATESAADAPARAGSSQVPSVPSQRESAGNPPAARDVSWRHPGDRRRDGESSWRPWRRREEEPTPLEVPADADLTSARRDYRDPDADPTRREIARLYLVAAGADMAVEERARLVAADAPELEPEPVVTVPAPSAMDMTPWLYPVPRAIEPAREVPAEDLVARWTVAPEPVAETTR